jgi:hypothetical protein
MRKHFAPKRFHNRARSPAYRGSAAGKFFNTDKKGSQNHHKTRVGEHLCKAMQAGGFSGCWLCVSPEGGKDRSAAQRVWRETDE